MENYVSRGTRNIPSSPERSRRQKFRSSCDCCSSSKVKCDQGHPTCARCEKLRIRCNYSPSQRMGKPPGRSRGPTNSSNSSRSKGKKKSRKFSAQDFADHIEEPFANQNTPSLDTFLLDPDSLMSMHWQANSSDIGSHAAGLNNGDLSSILFHNVETQVNPVSPSTTPQVLDMGSKTQRSAFEQDCQDTIFSTSPSSVAYGPQSYTEPTGSSVSSNETMIESQDCARITAMILPTLHSLQDASGVCSAMTTNKLVQPFPSIEQVLITNKAAMQSMNRIIDCPCSLSPQYALTLALIFHKILARYESIVDATANSLTVGDSDPTFARNFAVTSISVGAYIMDAEDERRMMIQLVINEVRKIKGLLERFQEKYCTAVDGDKDRKEGIYSALNIFLRSELKEKLENMINALDD